MEPKNGINKDGRPYSWKDDNALFTDLTEEQQEKCRQWVLCFCVPAVAFTDKVTSYGMKHILESCTGIYMTNNQFKDLMLQMGFYPKYKEELNWNFAVKIGPLKLANRYGNCRRNGSIWH